MRGKSSLAAEFDIKKYTASLETFAEYVSVELVSRCFAFSEQFDEVEVGLENDISSLAEGSV